MTPFHPAFHSVCGGHVRQFEAGVYRECCFCSPLETCIFDSSMEVLANKIKTQIENAPAKNQEDSMDLTAHEKEMKGL